MVGIEIYYKYPKQKRIGGFAPDLDTKGIRYNLKILQVFKV